jgi:hypothetical protein
MPEGLLSAIHLVLQTREARIARPNATYPKALRAATNSAILARTIDVRLTFELVDRHRPPIK